MKMIGQLLLPLFALLALAAGTPEVTQYSLDGANLISTSGSNLGLTEGSLVNNNWKTVSINGNQVTIFTNDCNSGSAPVERMSSQDERLIRGAIKRLIDGQRKMILGANGGISTSGNNDIIGNNNIGNNNRFYGGGIIQIGGGDGGGIKIGGGGNNSGNNVNGNLIIGPNSGRNGLGSNNVGNNSGNNVRGNLIIGANSGNVGSRIEGNNNIGNNNVNTGGGTMQIGPINGQGNGFSVFSNPRISMQKTDEYNYSIAKDNMPHNLARVFVNGDVLTYVYRDGQVLMKPIKCMQQDERMLMHQLEGQVEQEQKAFEEEMRRQ